MTWNAKRSILKDFLPSNDLTDKLMDRFVNLLRFFYFYFFHSLKQTASPLQKLCWRLYAQLQEFLHHIRHTILSP